ncbi:hypothetical protein CYMTET_55801 [Cymbomonas tetramitiformis]|uniref:S-adenosylmethionine-dependent methyltransferase domain-containing protein n=1 Tax=Cymbomonas tetramitiformis TaxID=36881 RepID=A0AAE0BDY3_9CHLO|nr:hypothetical protein CYMTET_55801 [Cymbomonas tetramitiformis]
MLLCLYCFTQAEYYEIIQTAGPGHVIRHRQVITKALRDITGVSDIIWRVADVMRLEGLEEREAESSDDALDDVPQEDSEAVGDTQIMDRGIKYWVNGKSQKTGFYCDQRESRARVRELSAGKRVLDLCCYSGGFALNAAMGGAESVVAVDSSGPALDIARANATLNGVEGICRFEKADCAKFMKAAAAAGDLFDIVVLDPPKLAPTRGSLRKARHKYRTLNALAMRLVPPGGLLMTCSCSGAMTQSGEFVDVVKEASVQVRRDITLLRKAGAAPCHTVTHWSL